MTGAQTSQTHIPRIQWIDTAKGLTIILVVMMHSTLGVSAETGLPNFMLGFVDYAQPFRIPAFFLLSGLLLARAIDRPWRTYIDGKVVHFIYFYVLWLTIQFAFKAYGLIEKIGWHETLEAYVVSYIQPFGTLWFIYLLPLFFVVTKLLRPLPHLMILPVLAVLEIAPIKTGAVVIDEFCNRYFYFYAGFAFASLLRRYADISVRQPFLAAMFILAWLCINAAYVVTGLAKFPGLSLLLGCFGALGLVAVAAWLVKLKGHKVLTVCGRNSLVIYLAFFLPMAATRTALIKSGVIENAGLISLIVTATAVLVPLLIYEVVKRTGYGHFLFVRPAFAHLPGTHSPESLRHSI